jgi:hypothetical protein
MDNLFIGRDVQAEKIVTELKKTYSDDPCKIISIFGIGGIGKTTLISNIEKKFNVDNNNIVIFKVNEDTEFKNLPEFVHDLTKSFLTKIPHISKDFTKVEEAKNGYLELIELSKAINESEQKKGDTGAKFGFKIFAIEINLPPFEKLEEYSLKIKKKIMPKYYKELLEVKNAGEYMAKIFITSLKKSIFTKEKKFLRKPIIYNEDKKPIKIIFVFDTYEKISDDINGWLIENLIPAFEKSEEFDPRFIISGREDITKTDNQQRWDRYKEHILKINLEEFQKEDIAEYLEKRGIDINRADEALENTDGVPYLLDIFCDVSYYGETAEIINKACERIFWNKNEEEKKWITIASFLNYYDKDALSVFLGKNEAERAYNWLKDNNEVTRVHEKEKEKFQIHKIIQKIIKKAIRQESPNDYDDYQHKAEIYKNIINDYPDTLKRNLMLDLCLFENFNEEALQKVYGYTKAFELNNFAGDNTEIFNRQSQTFRMKPEIREKFLKYYSLIDNKEVENSIKKIKDEWFKEKVDLEDKIKSIKNDISKTTEEESNKLKNINIEIENEDHELEVLKQEFLELSKKSNKYRYISYSLFISIILGILIAGASDIFMNNFLPWGYLISGIVIIFGIIVFIYNKKIKYKKIKKIKELEEKIGGKRNEIESLKQKTSQIELKENNNQYNNKFEQLEQRLNEPWI